jgi:hypothetical protein
MMNMNVLIERLIATHRLLNREIRRELAHRFPDQLRLARLKKQRLAVKDRLFRHVPEASELRRAARRFLVRFRPQRRLAVEG